jgi:hypothetical protein
MHWSDRIAARAGRAWGAKSSSCSVRADSGTCRFVPFLVHSSTAVRPFMSAPVSAQISPVRIVVSIANNIATVMAWLLVAMGAPSNPRPSHSCAISSSGIRRSRNGGFAGRRTSVVGLAAIDFHSRRGVEDVGVEREVATDSRPSNIFQPHVAPLA